MTRTGQGSVAGQQSMASTLTYEPRGLVRVVLGGGDEDWTLFGV